MSTENCGATQPVAFFRILRLAFETQSFRPVLAEVSFEPTKSLTLSQAAVGAGGRD